MEALHLHDPFRTAFLRALGDNDHTDNGDPVLTSEDQWRKFVSILEAEGLLDDHDVMDDIWQHVYKDAQLFQPQGAPRIRLPFSRWKDMLVDRHPPDMDEQEKALIHAGQHIEFFAEKVDQWDLDTLSREELSSLLYIIAKMETARDSVGEKLDRAWEDQCYSLMLGRMWALLGGKSLDERLKLRRVGEVNNPFRWQLDHIEEVEKASRTRKPRKIRFYPTRKSGPRGPLVSDSLFGVSQGYNGRFGVSVHLATSQADTDMLAVVVPGNAPMEVTSALMHAYTAAREMGTARGCLKCLGKDWTSREESLYYYERVRGFTLADLLVSGKHSKGRRVMLGEESMLFRYWSREVLWALAELLQQSRQQLLNYSLDLSNVVVSGRGLKLRLGNLRWGPQMSLFPDEADPYLLRRMRMLLRDYGRLLEEMLGLSSHACWHGWYTNVGRVMPKSSLVHVQQYEAMAGLEVQEGDELVVVLDAQGRWYTACDVVDDNTDRTGARPCVEVTWEDPKSREDTHSFRVCGRRPGRCRVLCRYYELEDAKSTPLFVSIPVTITPITISARLKAILQWCQLGMTHESGTELQGKATHYLDQPAWRDRRGKVWLSDFLTNPYFVEFSDADLDRVMEEYEELFEEEFKGGDEGSEAEEPPPPPYPRPPHD